MKRRHLSTDTERTSSPSPPRKRFSKAPPKVESLPCKLKFLRHWELTEEASRFLSLGNKVEEQALSDRTCPQLALVVYEPNFYQQILNQIASHAPPKMFDPEPMDIEDVEYYYTWWFPTFLPVLSLSWYWMLMENEEKWVR